MIEFLEFSKVLLVHVDLSTRRNRKLRSEFKIADVFMPVKADEWKGIEDKIYNTFCKITNHNNKPIWIWEKLRMESVSLRAEKPTHELLPRLVSNDENVFVLLNDGSKFWIYRSTGEPLKTIVSESVYLDESQ